MSVVRHDWKISHSYATDELKFDNEFSFTRSFRFRLYDANGNYAEITFQRSGTDFDAFQVKGILFAALFLPGAMLYVGTGARVGGTLYEDLRFAVVWKKGLGLKARIRSDTVGVGIKIASNATIVVVTAGREYRVGNLFIKVLAGAASLDTTNNILTITGSDVHITIGIGASFDAEDSLMGIANEDMNLTATQVSSGIKIVHDKIDEVVYFRWDALGRLYEIRRSSAYHSAWFIVSNNGKPIPLMHTLFSSGQKSSNFIDLGLTPGFGWRTQPYIDPDSVVGETYQVPVVPSRIVWLFNGDIVGFVFEGSIYRATGDKIADVVYARTIDLASEKALVTREIKALATFVTYQEDGLTVSLALEGTPSALDSAGAEWGYKYYSNGQWVEVTSLPSTWRYDPSFAVEIKAVDPDRHIDYASIIVVRSSRTNRPIEYRAALANDKEMYLYPQLNVEQLNANDYLKEIFVVYAGSSTDYGTNLESKAEVPSSLDSHDFDRTLNDPTIAKSYGFNVAVIYDPDTDTYTLSTGRIPTKLTLKVIPL